MRLEKSAQWGANKIFKNTYKVLVKSLKGRDHLGELGVKGMID